MSSASGPSPHRWSQVRHLPLCPAIQSLDDYEQAVMTGNLNAIAFLRSIDVLHSLLAADCQHVHYLIFEKVHPWAGQYRKAGQLATIAGFPAADPQRIAREMSMALFQTSELMEAALVAEDGFQWLAALAFLHIRFERIHPFLDGNGRTGRSILSVQFETLFGLRPSFEDQHAYRAALRAAAGKNLAPLMNFMGNSAGLPTLSGRWESRFRLAPRFLDISAEPTLDDDIAWSHVGVSDPQ